MLTKPTAKKRIFLVEDHRIVCEGLKLFIAQEPDLEVCGAAEDGPTALEALTERRPDAVVCDISLPGMNGIEFLKNMKAQYPEIAAVVFSMHDDSVYAERALRAGALGYVMKKESTAELIAALRKALKGEYYVSARVTGAMFNKALGANGPGKSASPSPIALLSDRELEIFELIGHGKSTTSIASALGVSPKTVETHRGHIKEKLQVSSATGLIRHATLWVEHQTAGN